MTNFKRYILIFIIYGLQFSLHAQVEEPVKWKNSIEKISNDEFWLIMQATIEKDWHMYSQFTPDGGVLPTVFEYKNQKPRDPPAARSSRP